MRRYRIWYGAAMVAALLIYIISNRSEALTVLLCLVVVPVLSFVIELVSLNGFKMEYSVKSSCHVGQETSPGNPDKQKKTGALLEGSS